jgi:hypothetical protein
MNRPSSATKANAPEKAPWTLLVDVLEKTGFGRISKYLGALAPQTSLHCLLLVMAAFFEITVRIESSDHNQKGTYLSPVDELGQRDVCVVAKDMVILEALCGSVLELDAEEVAKIGGRSSAQLNGKSRSVVSYGIAMSTYVCIARGNAYECP